MRYEILTGSALQEAETLLKHFPGACPTNGYSLVVGVRTEDNGRLIGVCTGNLGLAAELEFVFVHGLFRHQGIGHKLVEHFVRAVGNAHAERIVAQFITGTGEERNEVSFLSSVGFSGLTQGETILSAPVRALSDSPWAQPPEEKAVRKLTCLADMEYSEFLLYKQLLSNLPDFVQLKELDGSLLRELSFVCIQENQVRLSLLVSDHEGSLYLDSLYCAKGWERHLPGALQSMLHRALEMNETYSQLYLTCINQASYRLAQKIAQDIPVLERTAWRMYRRL